MKRILSLVLCIIMALSIIGCGAQETEKEITNTATYEDCVLVLNDAEKANMEDGTKIIKVNATYTNNSDEPLYAYCSFAVRAFQNDKVITELSDINGNEASLIREIKAGQNISVTYVFELVDDSSVEVLVGEPTAEQKTVGKKVYFAE